jgi:hypothetical protein
MSRNIIKTIKSESPDDHWDFLPIFGKVVLDLGCGINSEHMPTPWYFLETRKAKKVYGVDSDPNSYQWFRQNFNVQNFIPFMDNIDRIEKIEWYIKNIEPEIIKMDIEGAEIMFFALDPKYLLPVNHIAIEYHNYVCLMGCEKYLKENGFEIEYYAFENRDIEYQGVLYGKRKDKQN